MSATVCLHPSWQSNPALKFTVLQAVGLIERAHSTGNLKEFPYERRNLKGSGFVPDLGEANRTGVHHSLKTRA